MYELEWDNDINGVILSTSPQEHSLTQPPRPVFFEELNLLGFNQYWHYPECKEPLLWACGRHYFYRGKRVADVKGGGLYTAPTVNILPEGKNLILAPVDIRALIEKNKDIMNRISYEAMQFIYNIFKQYYTNNMSCSEDDLIDWDVLIERISKQNKKSYALIREDCDSFDIMPMDDALSSQKRIFHRRKIDRFIVSFSGGKDSQVTLDLASRILPPKSYTVLYSDTGYELPSSLAIYKKTQSRYRNFFPSLRFELVKNHQNIMHYWEQMGSPSRMQRWCCAVMKTAPLYRFLKNDTGLGKQPSVLVFEGTRAGESSRRSSYPRIGKGVKHNNIINARPILQWNNTEVYLYLLMHNLPINQAYRQGLSRVGCAICPYSNGISEYIVRSFYPQSINPFVSYIRKTSRTEGVQDVDVYVEEGRWKMRGGGKYLTDFPNRLDIIKNDAETLTAILYSPLEDIFQWIKTLNQVRYIRVQDGWKGEICFKQHTFNFDLLERKSDVVATFYGVKAAPVLLSRIQRILNKSTYCIHCEACEVECPTGALTVVPTVKIDSTKCIHCAKCLEFKDKGCIVANSLTRSSQVGASVTKKASLDRYHTFGLAESWVAAFLLSKQDFFTSEHGLNPNKQIPAMINWLRESEILSMKEKKATDLGYFLASIYLENPQVVWEIIWINLCTNSAICHWMSIKLEESILYTVSEIKAKLEIDRSDLSTKTLANAVNSYLNLVKSVDTYACRVKLFDIEFKGRIIQNIRRCAYTPSLLATAYSLYRYSERRGIHQLSIDELYSSEQLNGIYREFLITEDVLINQLKDLQENFQIFSLSTIHDSTIIELQSDLDSLQILKLLFRNSYS